MEAKKTYNAVIGELDDDQLDLVSGGTDLEEEEECIPTFADGDAYLEALYAGRPCITCEGCGLLLPIDEQPIVTCPRCGRQH